MTKTIELELEEALFLLELLTKIPMQGTKADLRKAMERSDGIEAKLKTVVVEAPAARVDLDKQALTAVSAGRRRH